MKLNAWMELSKVEIRLSWSLGLSGRELACIGTRANWGVRVLECGEVVGRALRSRELSRARV